MAPEVPARPRYLPRPRPYSPSLRYATLRRISERTARDEIPEVIRRAVLILECLAAGDATDQARAAEYLAQLERPLAITDVPCEKTAEHAHALADAHEDVARAEHRLRPSPLTARALSRALAAACRRAEFFSAALAQEYAL